MSAVVFHRIFMMSEIYVSEIFDKLEKENTKFVRKPQKKKIVTNKPTVKKSPVICVNN